MGFNEWKQSSDDYKTLCFHYRDGITTEDPTFTDGSQAFKNATDFVYGRTIDDVYKYRFQIDSNTNKDLRLVSGVGLTLWAAPELLPLLGSRPDLI